MMRLIAASGVTTRAATSRVAALATALAAALAAAACGGASVMEPAPLDTRNEQCRACRMSVSDARFASQVVAPGEEATFFDDLGCLKTHLEGQATLPPGLVVFVADHRTKAWVRVEQAVLSRVPGLETPMGSGLLAHVDEASRAADPAAAGGEVVALAEVVPARALAQEAK
jgi:copper chaperone NosL